MRRLVLQVSLVALFLASIGSGVAVGQTATGEISGIVLDSSGAVIPGATLQLTATEAGELVRSVESSEAGRFSLSFLRPAVYSIEVQSPGFKTLVRSGITVRVDDVVNLDLTLEPGVITESVTITEEAPLLETRTQTVGQVVEEETIRKLPLNGRNYLQLGNLTAGTVPNVRSRDKTFSAYGNRGVQNAFLLDGARNQIYIRGLDTRQRDAYRPSLDAILEFKVQTANFSAQYGASAGAIINVVSKTGTNALHGSAFEFLRNSELDAVNFFQPAGAGKPLFIRHQYGGSLGGPVVKNRAWWFGAFERTHISEEATLTATVPGKEFTDGRFGTLNVLDPATTEALPNGGGFVRTPFPNNVIPSSRFDSIGKSLADRYPQPNLPGTARNFVQSPLQSTRVNNGTFRGDVRIDNASSMFGRFSFNLLDFNKLPPLPPPAGQPATREAPSWSVGYGYTRTFSPTVVNELRFAWNRGGVLDDLTTPRDEVIPGALAPDVLNGTPIFRMAGFTSIGIAPSGSGNTPLEKTSAVWNVSNNTSIFRGNHSVKFGFEYTQVKVKSFSALQARGRFNFTGVFSQDPQSRPGTGSAVADLLLGLPDLTDTGTTATADERAHNLYWFVLDDWSVTRKLTLSLGFRYEVALPYTEINDRFANFISEGGPLFGQYILAGDDRRPRSLLDSDYNNLAPRFGLAYRATERLVVRAAYGIFYGQDEGTSLNRRLATNPPFFGFGGVRATSDRLFASSTFKLDDGLPPRQEPPGRDEFVLDPNSTVRLKSMTSRYTTPYVQQWTFGVQRELPGNMVWEVNYVGNHGLKLWAVLEGNQPDPGPGSPNDRRPLAEFTRGSIWRSSPWASSNYHGVSTRLEKRFSQGLSFLLGYTYGRAIDTASDSGICDGCGASLSLFAQDARTAARSQRSAANHNIPQRFTASGILELPFGEGRAFANNGAWKHILGGWELTGIFTLSDGIPFTPQLSFDNANTGTRSRPDRIRDGNLDNPSVDRWFDVGAFVFPAAFTFGNSGRNVLVGPGTINVDVGIHRSFKLPFNEVSTLEFRAEAFNLANRAQFDLPGASIGTSSAGVIGRTIAPNRQLQFGLRLSF